MKGLKTDTQMQVLYIRPLFTSEIKYVAEQADIVLLLASRQAY